jgi:hypothetical protein
MNRMNAASVEGGYDVRMHQLGYQSDFFVKSIDEGSLLRQPSRKDFDCNVPIHGSVSRAVNLAHATRA